MHPIVFNYNHPSFNNVWRRNVVRETGHLLRNRDEFEIPAVNLELIRRMPIYTLPKAWNSLGEIRSQANRTTFIAELNNFLRGADQAVPPSPPSY